MYHLTRSFFSFVMPAIYDSLVASHGMTPHEAWRVAYVVPFIIITAVALAMLFLCEDTPTGKWSDRHLWTNELSPPNSNLHGDIVDINANGMPTDISTAASTYNGSTVDIEKKGGTQSPRISDKDVPVMGQIDTLKQEAVVAPTRKEAVAVAFSLSTMAYGCSFGAELAIDSSLGSYYAANFPSLGQTGSGQWAAMFGLLNVIFRPAGGFLGDIAYRSTGNIWSKKLLLVFLGVIMSAFLLAVGLTNPTDQATMFGLMAGMAFFLEAANGAIFALVPHVHPYANGKLYLMETTIEIFAADANCARYCFRYSRRIWKPWGYHFCNNLPVQRLGVWKVDVDHGCGFFGGESGCELDKTCPKSSCCLFIELYMIVSNTISSSKFEPPKLYSGALPSTTSGHVTPSPG